MVNLKHANQDLWKQKFKYEDLRVAMAMFNHNEQSTFDLKSDYHNIDIVQHPKQSVMLLGKAAL